MSQSSHSESPQSAELVHVTLTFDHQLTDSELEQLKLTTKALEVRAARPDRVIVTGDPWEQAQPHQSTTVTVDAPFGYYILSGGAEAREKADANHNYMLCKSYPFAVDTWAADFFNNGPS